MEHIFSLLLLLCALTPPELDGAPASLQITPSHPDSPTVRASSNTTMITTIEHSSPAEPSQETHTFSVITKAEANTAAFSDMQGSRLETATAPALELMNFTTQQPSPPKAIPAELNTQEPNSTSDITMNANQTIGSTGAVDTTPPVSGTTVNDSDSYRTDLGRTNPTAMPTTEQQTRQPPLPGGMPSTHRLSTSAAWKSPEPTTASTLGHATSVKIPFQTSTTMKSTTKKPAPPVKPRTTPETEEPSETHGIVAAVLIGLILLMMFVGIIFIMVRKHRWQRRQLENSEWAGPSPFLDGSSQPHFSRDSTKGDSKRISFAGFLPQNLSKRHSLLDDTDEGLVMDVVPGTTFGQNDAAETKPQNGTAQEDKGQTEKEQDHKNASENLPLTSAVADHTPNPGAAANKENNNSEVNLQETAQPSTTDIPPPPPLTTTSTDISVPPPPLTTISTDIPPPPPLTTTTTDISLPPPPPSMTSAEMPPPPPTTTSTDIPPPPPDTDLQSSNDTTAPSEVPIPPAPPLP